MFLTSTNNIKFLDDDLFLHLKIENKYQKDGKLAQNRTLKTSILIFKKIKSTRTGSLSPSLFYKEHRVNIEVPCVCLCKPFHLTNGFSVNEVPLWPRGSWNFVAMVSQRLSRHLCSS